MKFRMLLVKGKTTHAFWCNYPEIIGNHHVKILTTYPEPLLNDWEEGYIYVVGSEPRQYYKLDTQHCRISKSKINDDWFQIDIQEVLHWTHSMTDDYYTRQAAEADVEVR